LRFFVAILLDRESRDEKEFAAKRLKKTQKRKAEEYVTRNELMVGSFCEFCAFSWL
jgi:hypothetical protein